MILREYDDEPTLATEPPLVIALAAPKACGKTAYLGALRHLGNYASYVIDGVCYRLSRVRGYGATEIISQQAEDHIEFVCESVRSGELSETTAGWHAYHFRIERLVQGEVWRRDIYVLDAMGGHLFPSMDGDAVAREELDERPRLSERLIELGLTDANHVLMVFINEPSRPGAKWQMQPHVPSAFADYIEGMRFDRVVLYVACADILFPRLGNLREVLAQYNSDVESTSALRKYIEHFRGSPHCDFTIDLIQYLANAGLVATGRDDTHDRLSLFWGSSLGVERASGRPNVSGSPGVLANINDWIPVQVFEPVLWSASMLSQGWSTQ